VRCSPVFALVEKCGPADCASDVRGESALPGSKKAMARARLITETKTRIAAAGRASTCPHAGAGEIYTSARWRGSARRQAQRTRGCRAARRPNPWGSRALPGSEVPRFPKPSPYVRARMRPARARCWRLRLGPPEADACVGGCSVEIGPDNREVVCTSSDRVTARAHMRRCVVCGGRLHTPSSTRPAACGLNQSQSQRRTFIHAALPGVSVLTCLARVSEKLYLGV
jgi:hypothetical protein